MLWVYEKYFAQWNPAYFSTNSPTSSLHPYTINIGTLEVEERTPSVGEASIINSTSVSNYYSGETVGVRVYQGKSGSTYNYKRGSYKRNQLSALRIKGERMPDIVLEEGSVPDDGVHTDGYWYVKVKAVSSFVLKDDVWKPIWRHVSDGSVMTKWVYERYPAQWDATAFTTGVLRSLRRYTINIGTLEVEERSPSVGEAALSTSSTVSSYNSGSAVTVEVYQGETGSGITPHAYKTSVYTRNQLSALRIKGERMSDVIREEGTVPDDGIHTDGYWYVKVKAVPGFVLKDGVWKPIEDVFVLKNGQWKNIQ